jgi:hypothetical protein
MTNMARARKNASASRSHAPARPDRSLSTATSQRPIWEIVVEIGTQIPAEEWAKLPDDASINYSHYLHDAPENA